MTATEALLAMKVGCRVVPTNWKSFEDYYEIRGNFVCYIHKNLGLGNPVASVSEFTEEYKDMVWSLYDDRASIISDEDRM